MGVFDDALKKRMGQQAELDAAAAARAEDARIKREQRKAALTAARDLLIEAGDVLVGAGVPALPMLRFGVEDHYHPERSEADVVLIGYGWVTGHFGVGTGGRFFSPQIPATVKEETILGAWMISNLNARRGDEFYFVKQPESYDTGYISLFRGPGAEASVQVDFDDVLGASYTSIRSLLPEEVANLVAWHKRNSA